MALSLELNGTISVDGEDGTYVTGSSTVSFGTGGTGTAFIFVLFFSFFFFFF